MPPKKEQDPFANSLTDRTGITINIFGFLGMIASIFIAGWMLNEKLNSIQKSIDGKFPRQEMVEWTDQLRERNMVIKTSGLDVPRIKYQ